MNAEFVCSTVERFSSLHQSSIEFDFQQPINQRTTPPTHPPINRRHHQHQHHHRILTPIVANARLISALLLFTQTSSLHQHHVSHITARFFIHSFIHSLWFRSRKQFKKVINIIYKNSCFFQNNFPLRFFHLCNRNGRCTRDIK